MNTFALDHLTGIIVSPLNIGLNISLYNLRYNVFTNNSLYIDWLGIWPIIFIVTFNNEYLSYFLASQNLFISFLKSEDFSML